MRRNEQLRFAKELRVRSTDAERCLWRHLRAKQVFGAKFRRQHPIGPFIVDFVCLEKRLVVEVDGGQHDEGKPADDSRTAKLEAAGFRVLRFWNNQVLRETDAVMRVIADAIQTGPSP